MQKKFRNKREFSGVDNTMILCKIVDHVANWYPLIQNYRNETMHTQFTVRGRDEYEFEWEPDTDKYRDVNVTCPNGYKFTIRVAIGYYINSDEVEIPNEWTECYPWIEMGDISYDLALTGYCDEIENPLKLMHEMDSEFRYEVWCNEGQANNYFKKLDAKPVTELGGLF